MKRLFLAVLMVCLLAGNAMAGNSLDIAKAAEDADFKARVGLYMIKAAAAIISESAATENHTERVAFAQSVLAGSVNIAQYSRAVAITNTTVSSAMLILDAEGNCVGGSGVSDGDLEFTVNSLIPAFAGY